nr:dinitrogenase iron-molybdenum cofactor biosynthesis protein [Desulfobulbaceae bacterium]
MTTTKVLEQSGSCNCACTEKSESYPVLPLCPKENFRVKYWPEQPAGRAIPLEGALTWIKENLEQGAHLTNIEIGGPGDPLATPELTLEIASRICSEYPDILLQIATLGLNGSQYASDLANAGIKGVTMLVDAVDAEIAQKIYAWIRPSTKTVPIKQATETLVTEQSLAVSAFQDAGLAVTIRTTVYSGANDDHIEVIAKKMSALGVDSMDILPFTASDVSSDNDTPCHAKKKLMQKLRAQACKHVTNVTIRHKNPAKIGSGCTSLAGNCASHDAMLPKPSKDKPNVAVVSSNGMAIDLHLGQAYQALIYGPREDGLPCLLGTRPVPEPGGGVSRWEGLAESIKDCFALLTASAGDSPRKILAQHGITVLINEGEIEGTVDVLFGGGKKGKKKC